MEEIDGSIREDEPSKNANGKLDNKILTGEQLQSKQIDNSVKQTRLLAQQTYILLFTALIAASALITSAYSIWWSFDTYQKSNKPMVVVTHAREGDTKGYFSVWNSGTGVAYQVSIMVHLADHESNVRASWVEEVLDAALELESKSEDTQNIYNNEGAPYSENIPNVIAPGYANGYKMNLELSNMLKGLFILVTYQDVLGNPYYSCWDGLAWRSGAGLDTPLPKYKRVKNTPVPYFWRLLVNDPHQSGGNLFRYERWLKEEARFLHENGYGDVLAQLEAVSRRKQ